MEKCAEKGNLEFTAVHDGNSGFQRCVSGKETFLGVQSKYLSCLHVHQKLLVKKLYTKIYLFISF